MPEADPHIGILILAAGSSSRLGQPKQLLPVADEPLLVHTVRAAENSQASETVVVIGARAEEVGAALKGHDVRIVINREWEQGMGSSLKAGLGHMTGLQALIVSVCDQPFISEEIFNALIDEWKKGEHTMVASSYEGTVGVPALFGKEHFGEMQSLPDNTGAKKLLFKDRISTIPFPKGKVDIDTPQDWQDYLESR